jgi:hypothetical protein
LVRQQIVSLAFSSRRHFEKNNTISEQAGC